MSALKKYMPPLFILLLIALGAAMPWLTAWAQDARISNLQEKLELNTVSLTLQKDADVSPALKVVSEEHTAILWEKETRMTEEEVFSAAVEAIGQMGRYDLLPAEEICMLMEDGGWAEPLLCIAEDGSTALVWNCFWESSPCAFSVDDASGKAVQFLIDNPDWLVKEESDAIQQSLEKQWSQFFLDYYGKDLEQADGLNLSIYEDRTSFNY